MSKESDYSLNEKDVTIGNSEVERKKETRLKIIKIRKELIYQEMK